MQMSAGRSWWPRGLVILAFVATAFHAWAGWVDEKKLVLHPVGPLSAYALMLWVLAAVLGMVTIVIMKPRPASGLIVTGMALVGIILLMVR